MKIIMNKMKNTRDGITTDLTLQKKKISELKQRLRKTKNKIKKIILKMSRA